MNAPDATPVALDTWLRREAYTFFSACRIRFTA